MSERRRYHRLDMSIPMRFCIPPRMVKRQAVTVDIGGQGIGFLTSAEVEVRQELLVYIELPDRQHAELHAQVVRVTPQGKGAEKLVVVKLLDPIKFDERQFVKFYAAKLNKTFSAK